MITRAQWIVLALGAWTFIALGIMALLQNVDVEFFFILCLAGFLTIIQLNGPSAAMPRWRRRINLVVFASMVVFILLVLKQVVDIIA